MVHMVRRMRILCLHPRRLHPRRLHPLGLHPRRLRLLGLHPRRLHRGLLLRCGLAERVDRLVPFSYRVLLCRNIAEDFTECLQSL